MAYELERTTSWNCCAKAWSGVRATSSKRRWLDADYSKVTLQDDEYGVSRRTHPPGRGQRGVVRGIKSRPGMDRTAAGDLGRLRFHSFVAGNRQPRRIAGPAPTTTPAASRNPMATMPLRRPSPRPAYNSVCCSTRRAATAGRVTMPLPMPVMMPGTGSPRSTGETPALSVPSTANDRPAASVNTGFAHAFDAACQTKPPRARRDRGGQVSAGRPASRRRVRAERRADIRRSCGGAGQPTPPEQVQPMAPPVRRR